MAEEWDVFALQPGGDYAQPEYLATLYEASQKSIRVELDGTGSGSFAINRSSPECTEAILAQGNLVKVRIPEISTDYIFAFFLETGDFTLISSDEAGGEMLHFGGRGNLSYLEYAVAWFESFVTGGQDPQDNVWRAYAAGTGSKPGQILRRMLEEMQHVDRPQQPLPLLTIDFDYDVDSSAGTWLSTAATNEFSYQVGETGLAIAERLRPTGIVLQMDPGFLLSAYNPANFGRDLTGDAFGADVVRFQRGVNIATELRRERAPIESTTHMAVAGEQDHFGRAVASNADSRVTKEGYLAAFGTDVIALSGLGRAEIAARQNARQTVAFPIVNRRTAVSLADPVTVGAVAATPGLATAGYYLPGPEGTNGDFWVGDKVRLHTGSGAFDYNEVDMVVKAITITREDDNAELIVIPELEEGPPATCPSPTATGSFYPLGGSGKIPNPSPTGNVLYLRAGIAGPTTVSPGHQGSWHFALYGAGGVGTVDYWGDCTGSYPRCIVVGDGTMTIHTAEYLGTARSLRATLFHDNGSAHVVDSTVTFAAGTDVVIDVSSHDQTYCTHWVDVRDYVLGACGSKVGFAGFDWATA